ncbi:DNA repair exonuclease [uncultured virus]|nr:DNA repair exonuclease [uncultured virus]
MTTHRDHNYGVSALVVGDPHFKVANVRETDAMVEAIIRVANQRRPDIIVVLGDILDRHETIHVSPLTRAVKFLGRLMEIAPTYVLIGNHDLKNNRQFLSDEHPFVALKYWNKDRMIIVDTTTTVTIKGQKLVFVPYVPPGRFVEALDYNPGWQDAICIFGHQEFRGAQMGAIISTEGDEWPLTYPYVVTGHIHDYQELQVNILYTGTPIQHAFGDRHDKTISYFEFQSSTERLHDRIDLELPRKQIARITCAEVSTYVPQANCELKIIIRGTSGEIKAIMKHPNIDVWKRAGYKIVYKDLPAGETLETNPDENRPIISKAPLRFSTVLYNTIRTNPRLGTLYNRIFGGVRVDPIGNPNIWSNLNEEKIGPLTLKIENLRLSSDPKSPPVPGALMLNTVGSTTLTLNPQIPHAIPTDYRPSIDENVILTSTSPVPISSVAIPNFQTNNSGMVSLMMSKPVIVTTPSVQTGNQVLSDCHQDSMGPQQVCYIPRAPAIPLTLTSIPNIIQTPGKL